MLYGKNKTQNTANASTEVMHSIRVALTPFLLP